MPDVEMPNGDIVNFPDEMPKEQIRGLIASKFPEVVPKQKSFPEKAKDVAIGLKEGIKQGSTFGFGDELQAGIAAYSSAPFVEGLTLGDAYDQALSDFRNDYKTARQNAPVTTTVGELAGGIATGAGAASKIPSIIKGSGVLSGAARGAGSGAVSGGIYGFGQGEGGAGNRLTSGAVGGTVGAIGGGAIGAGVAGVGNSLAARAAKLLEIKRRQPGPMVSSAPNTPPEAIDKVINRLRADYPDEAQFQQALQAYQNENATLGEIGGERVKDLAIGAAQYPSGKTATQEFFYGKQPAPGQAPSGGALDAARDNVTKSIEKNISGNQDYFGTLDDIMAKGQARAKPLYDKANEQFVKPSETILKPEIQDAIAQARKQYPSELQGLPQTSVKVLDYAKRVMDDDIGAAQRAGQGNYARSRLEIKNQLVNEIDSQVPDYAQARKTAGDYLTNKSAMESGREFVKDNSQQIARKFKKLGPTEQEAYRSGVVQKVREMADSVKDNGNVHSRIFGSAEAKAKLKAVLSDKEYDQLSKDLWASDRIYQFRNKVLGNSTTASKQISAEEFASPENAILQELAKGRPVSAGLEGIKKWVGQRFDGLSDETAGDVAKILTTQDPREKLKIIRVINDRINPKEAANKTNSNALKVYFQIEDMIKPYKGTAPGIAAGQIGTYPLREPLSITVTPKDKQ